MTSRWAHASKTLLASTALCSVGALVCGFLSSRGNLWERFTIVSAFGMICSMIVTFILSPTI
jgi:predicted RND superfamily exporter protein